MKLIELFAGVGGFSLAAHWVGWETVACVEINEFCQKVLSKKFPNARRYSDIKDFDGKKWKGRVDIITGGFPCQPFSTAGQRKGNSDDRALWPEMLRVVREASPTWVVGENVAGILSMENKSPFSKWVQIGMENSSYLRKFYNRFFYRKRQTYVLNEIVESLEKEGYSVITFVIPSGAVQAPHKRERVWIIAKNTNKEQLQRSKKTDKRKKPSKVRASLQNKSRTGDCNASNPNGIRQSGQGQLGGRLCSKKSCEREVDRVVNENQFKKEWYEVASQFCRVDDGVSKGLDKNRRPRLESLGNSVQPQVVFEIFKAIIEFEKAT